MVRLHVRRKNMQGLFILLIILCCVFLKACVRHRPNIDIAHTPERTQEYNFTRHWHRQHKSLWSDILAKFKGKADIHYLEIGVFEGASLIWMLDNILTHDTARVTCIDFFPDDLEQIFFSNLDLSGSAHKVTTIKELSVTALRKLPFDSFDIIYVDASHTADNVMSDTMLSWPLLKPGGLLIFDDYLLDAKLQPEEFRPQVAVDAFITAYRNHIEIVHRGYQVIARKRKINIPDSIHIYDADYFISIGKYIYFLRDKELYHSTTTERIELSTKEKQMLDKLAWTRKFGETEFSPDNETLNSKDFINLMKKLSH
jgi:predicted O-methyltransferase YrrM